LPPQPASIFAKAPKYTVIIGRWVTLPSRVLLATYFVHCQLAKCAVLVVVDDSLLSLISGEVERHEAAPNKRHTIQWG